MDLDAEPRSLPTEVRVVCLCGYQDGANCHVSCISSGAIRKLTLRKTIAERMLTIICSSFSESGQFSTDNVIFFRHLSVFLMYYVFTICCLVLGSSKDNFLLLLHF